MRRCVAVFGGSRMRPGSEEYRQAEELGRALAESGYDLVNGGFGGAMEATARGAREGGACVTGVTIPLFGKAGNDYLDREVSASVIWERAKKMLDASEGIVALPGSTGTLAELSTAWEFVHKGVLSPRPLVFLGTFWAPLVDLLCPDPDATAWCGGAVRIASDPADAVRFLDEFFEL